MKIKSIRARPVLVPMNPPVVSKSGRFDAMSYVLVDVTTDDGLTGMAYLWSFSSRGSVAVLAALRELEGVALAADALSTEALWHSMWRKIAQWGHGGIAVLAVAAIDIACWDLRGKVAGRSVAQLLGQRAERVPAYYSGGLWLVDDLAVLEDEAKRAAQQGFRAAKMRVGRETPDEDLAAIAAVWRGLGDGGELMVDGNCGWSHMAAANWLARCDDVRLRWVEDPTDQDDIEGHAALAAAYRTPITIGEKAFGPHELIRIVRAHAADILMPDLQRVGGVTPWLQVQEVASTAGIPVCSHLFPEFNVQLMAAAPTGLYLEYMDWCAGLFNERLDIRDGHATVPNRPGFGLTWNEPMIERLVDRSAM